MHVRAVSSLAFLSFVAGCSAVSGTSDRASPSDGSSSTDAATATADVTAGTFPLQHVADVDLPGRSTRFDYQDIDHTRGRLVVAHMNDAAVVVVDLQQRSVAKVLPNIPVARGIAIAEEEARIFVTSSPNTLVIIDAVTLAEVGRVQTGRAPDGVTWDPVHKVVAVSDQQDGALSLIASSGTGTRTQIRVGAETGNAQYEPTRSTIWITAVESDGSGKLVEVDPVGASVKRKIDLPGCEGAHGLRFAPDGKSAFVACEGNDVLARVDLGASESVVTSPTGSGPDVMSVDPGLGLLYVAAESGNLVVFDMNKPGLVAVDRENVGAHAHSVAVDPTTHQTYYPLLAGPAGTPVLRIMEPNLQP